MAEKLDSYDFGRNAPEYDWDDWLDGKPTRLRQGEDFTIAVVSIRAQAHAQARARGLRAVTHREDEKTLVIQAVKE